MAKKLKKSQKIFILITIVIIILIFEGINIKSFSTEISSIEDKTKLEDDRENKTNLATEPVFTLYKQDGETYEPIAGTKFMITDLEGNQVIGTDGQIVGELETINGIDYYVLTTDENGFIQTNLPKGIYKAIEIYANEAYQLAEDEEKRTYYFEISSTTLKNPEWINGINGYSWNHIQSTVINSNGGIVAAGYFSEYSPEVTGDFYDGIDLNADGVIDEISQGNKDGIIISYDEEGNYLWSKTLSGKDDDGFNSIIQTQEGDYIIVGYTASPTVYFDGKLVEDLSQSNYDLKNKDGFLMKISQDGIYEWGIRLGGNKEEEIIKVLETSTKQIVVIGNFNSKVYHFYENDANHNMVENLQNEGEQSSFLATYSADGKYKWSQKIGGDSYTEICDITEIAGNLAVGINYKGTIFIEEDHAISSYLADYQDGVILNYSLAGKWNWKYEMYSDASSMYPDNKYIRITAITTTQENNLAVAIECTNAVKGRKSDEEEYRTIYTCQTRGITADVFLLSNNGELIKNLYDLSATVVFGGYDCATVVFNDMITTTNNDILLGGYYYAERAIDVNKDGSTSGEYDFQSSSNYNSNGFVIQIDLEGNVKFSDCMYRSNRELYAPSNVTSVNEINDEKIIAGGNFYWETITTKTMYSRTTEEDRNYINRIGNVDSFVFLENKEDKEIEILEATNLTVENFKKTYTITTEIKSHIEDNREVKGGQITGIYNQTIDGIEYTEEGIHYVETVKYGETSKQEITITPEEGYKIEKIMINEEEYKNFTTDENGNTTIPVFSNVTQNMHITVTFSKKIFQIEGLPVTGAREVILVDFISMILICLGMIKLKKFFHSSKN